jgi:peptidoglycan/xylan/chitin deacetylase (PgdA/CDA1 family)/uncharacterized caspase-like protein
MFSRSALLAGAMGCLLVAGGAAWAGRPSARPAADAAAAAQASPAADGGADMQAMLADYRRVIVLLDDEKSLDPANRRAALIVGQQLFRDKMEHQERLQQTLDAMLAGSAADRFDRIGDVLEAIESDPGYYDADRLAFREVLEALQTAVAQDGSLPAIKLHKRIGEDLDALAEIELHYNKEISQIFSHFETRAIVQRREKWQDYVAHLKTLYTRDGVLKDFGVILQVTNPNLPNDDPNPEIFGNKLPAKTVALTFDDGPHPQYTEQIVAVLKQYGVPATFFEVGRNIGSIDANGQPKLGAGAAISRKLLADGFVIGNHSYTHALLSKESGAALKAEIDNTDRLLLAVDANRPPLFRFPYGAHNAEGMQLLHDAHLLPINWSVDSEDWADPVPNSIADRVLRQVDAAGHGIILFHDIHARTITALPLVLDRLVAEGYHFAAWDGTGFSAAAEPTAAAKQTVTTGYAESWAVVIGINDYDKWPRLQYARNDSSAVHDLLTGKFGFAEDHVIMLQDGAATRSAILSAFSDRLGGDALKKNDRVFVFFAGHGATLKLNSGREVGYIIPVDADPAETARDAIAMTEIQNIAENLAAKHVFFVMDACYSGLGLTRGGSGGYLSENARRVGRQMLTAGGADQMVADGGPEGHSVFTWTLLQALNGKADLNGDGLITATELAAYVAPAVASVSLQTPAFGSLPGSEGGDFVFELPAQTEFLNAGTSQLPGDAIALNNKLDAAAPAVTPAALPGSPATVAPAKVADLQGAEQTLPAVPAVPRSARLQAQQANDRGLQLYKEKRYDEASAAFTEALQLRPDFALAANNLGFVYYKQEKYAEAARWFENTVKLDPSRAVAYLNLGDAYAHVGNPDAAQKAYGTYLELAPNGPAAATVRAQLKPPQ